MINLLLGLYGLLIATFIFAYVKAVINLIKGR